MSAGEYKAAKAEEKARARFGRLRRELPRRTDLDGAPDEELTLCAPRYNNTPRS